MNKTLSISYMVASSRLSCESMFEKCVRVCVCVWFVVASSGSFPQLSLGGLGRLDKHHKDNIGETRAAIQKSETTSWGVNRCGLVAVHIRR